MFDSTLALYRKTIKRYPPLHKASHWLMSHTIIPVLETTKNFKTIQDDPFWFRLELLTNNHEAETTIQFREILEEGMTVLDIGAHIGYYVRLASSLVGNQGKVLAFEPNPNTYQTLTKNAKSLSNVHTAQVAISDEAGTAELYDYLMMSASGSLNYDESMLDLQQAQLNEHDVAPRLNGDFEVKKYSVETIVLDDYLHQMGIIEVDFVKMDIEGAELNALRGLKNTIAQSPTLKLIMEYNPKALEAFGHDPANAFHEVMNFGFTQVSVVEDDGTLRPITNDRERIDAMTAELLKNIGVVNLLFSK